MLHYTSICTPVSHAYCIALVPIKERSGIDEYDTAVEHRSTTGIIHRVYVSTRTAAAAAFVAHTKTRNILTRYVQKVPIHRHHAAGSQTGFKFPTTAVLYVFLLPTCILYCHMNECQKICQMECGREGHKTHPVFRSAVVAPVQHGTCTRWIFERLS